MHTFNIRGASSDRLNSSGDKLFVRLGDVRLELSQNSGNVGFCRQVGQNLQLEEADMQRIGV